MLTGVTCRYVRSMVSAQLGGEDKAASTLGQCAPQNYVNQQAGFQGLPDNAAIDPCGLVAYSYFNDTFAISTQQPGAAAATPVTLDVSSSSTPCFIWPVCCMLPSHFIWKGWKSCIWHVSYCCVVCTASHVVQGP